jgi:hypothetical protein
MGINLGRDKTIDDLERHLADISRYDDEAEYGDEVYDVRLNPNLTEDEVGDALFWARFMRGIMLVIGSAGAGKGLFANMLAWKLRYYFGKRVLMDYKPRKLFDEVCKAGGYPPYIPFNTSVLVEQLGRMSEVATVNTRMAQSGVKYDEALGSSVHEWVSTKGRVFLKNSVLVLDEFKRYVDKRRPFNPIGLTLYDVFDIWRHLDILIIGIAIDERELDQKRCIPKLTTIVRCTWLNDYTVKKHNLAPYSAMVDITPVRYVGIAGEGVLDMSSPTIRRIVEGGKPRECLGGKRWVDIYNTKDAKDIFVPKSLRKAARD